jgi:dihydrofolate synthase/folylpolyglutamate synthase
VTFDEACAWLDQRINREAVAGRYGDLTLEPVERVLHVLGDPHTTYPVIHVTGTNGKGTVVAVAEAVLVAHGLAVGAYTSPHLASVTERLRWNGEPITEEAFAMQVAQVADAETLAGVTLSWFEAVTCVALTWFAEIAVDVAVVEVGLLGRFDATNVVRADVAVLTNVGRDHTDGQGDWRRAVATEKLGIVEPTSWLVLGEPDDLLDELVASLPVSQVWRAGEDFEVLDNRLAVGGRFLTLRTPHQVLDELFLPLHGEHQGANAATAVAAVSAFFDRALHQDAVEDALAQVAMPARLEVLRQQPLVVLDSAHNPPALARSVEAFAEDFEIEGRRHLVIGMLADKDVELALDALALETWDTCTCTTPASPRALDAADLAARIGGRGSQTTVVDDPRRAIDAALAAADEADAVLVVGSFYLAAAVRAHLGRRST